MLKFFKDLAGKSETFQDELLDTVMHLLLNVPIEIIYQPPSTDLNNDVLI